MDSRTNGTPLETFAAAFVDAGKRVASVEDALEGARHIVAETISDSADIRKLLRHAMFEEGVVVSKNVVDAVDEQQKFKMYYDYREPAKQIPSHACSPSAAARPRTSFTSSSNSIRNAPSNSSRAKFTSSPATGLPN